jgi:predicted ATPase/class 3 adenylate cyclase
MDDDRLIERAELIRQGRSFAIYRAKPDDADMPHLLKVISAQENVSHAATRLENEYAVSRELDHPNIVRADRMVHTAKGPVLVFTDTGRTSLDQIVDGPVAVEQVRQIGLDLAKALAFLHGKGIVHRDIKPSNVIAFSDLSGLALIDFCLAARLEDLQEQKTVKPLIGGTAAYMAPEQSGRMNRRVDHRADLYALGITLYELLTGQRPFADDDPAALLHRHLTEEPAAPTDLIADAPQDLSDVVMRLIQKNPEDRYQSAEEVLAALDGSKARAPMGALHIPDRLFGRDALIDELRGLVAAPQGRSGGRLIRVAGRSGTGKTALIEQALEPEVARGGLFVRGKFDQLDHERPYGAVLDAFNAALRTLLSGNTEEVEAWRRKLLDALSPNAQVLLDILPAYEALLGPQPAVAKLGLNEAQIRMSLVFRRFVGALSGPDAPLILFLDDLQWSDSASRDLIELLLGDSEIRNLTILASYRDNEIGPAHPVTLMFSRLADRMDLPPAIEVGPLDRASALGLIAQSVGQSEESVAQLGDLILAKTDGNPFFLRQFLLALHRKKLLRPDPEHGHWTWAVDEINREQITDNVADLVIERILDLPEETRQIVQLAACFGNRFDGEILSVANGMAPFQVARLLERAVQAEVVLPVDNDGEENSSRFRFQHDRVQQAAYSMVPIEQRGRMHAHIGSLLIERLPGVERDARLIEITDHLAAGRQYLDETVGLRLRDLAISAARLSKSANAYDAAVHYLTVAEEIMGTDAWTDAPELAFAVTLEQAEAAYLRNRTDDAERIAGELLNRPLDALDKVRVQELVILLHTSQLNYRKALAVGIEALRLLEEKLPLKPTMPGVLKELLVTKARLSGRSDRSLLRMRKMTDPQKIAAMRVLVLLAPPAYFSAPNLLPLIALRMVQLSVRHGNAPHSAYGYVIYGMLHCAVLGDPQRGLAYGELARQCAVDFEAQDIEGRILMVFAGFIQHWSAPLEDTLPVFLEGAEKAVSAGDLEYHGYTRYGHASYALMGGAALPKVSDFLEQHLAAVTDSRHEKTRRIMLMASASIGRMRGLPDNSDAEHFDEAENFALWTEQADATSLAYFHKYKLLEALMADDYAGVLAHVRGMEANLNGILSMAYQGFYQFYEALALIETGLGTSGAVRMAKLARARRLTRRIERWARHAPQTFQHRADLLRAELAAANGKAEAAMARFEEAIRAARRAGAQHDLGLFLERSARFYQGRGAEAAAERHLTDAVSAFEVWGGDGWATSLRERYPSLAAHHRNAALETTATSTGSSSSSIQIVDTTTLIRAASALTQKVSLREVITEVMRAMAVNAGADKGVLLLKSGDAVLVAAETDTSRAVHVFDDLALEDYEAMPVSVANYVMRSTDRVVIDDAPTDQDFRHDAYVVAREPSSILCVPLFSKGEVSGAVYLENTKVRGAFTPERCATIETLGAQAAVSIENARLYDDLRGSLERQVELTSAHARFVPHHFLETIGRPSITDVRLGDHVQAEASILFSDIRGFTSLVENMEPTEAIDFINTYLSKMEPAVQAGGGFVDSYVGDAVMAVFDRGPEAAIDAAITMMRDLRDWTRRREGEGQNSIRIGIGIASGELIFGTIGAANRLKCGVIGDTVNLAARIEGLTKHYNLGLLISQGTYRTLPDPERYNIREVDLVTVVGREAPVRLFEVFDADPVKVRDQKLRTREDVARGLRLYRSGAVDQAAAIFEQCRNIGPDDPLLMMLAERCRRHATLASDPEWTGIERIERK